MADLKVAIWEEWSAFSLDRHGEAELAGLVQGLEPAQGRDGVVLRTPRRFVLRRFFRLWSRWNQEEHALPPRLFPQRSESGTRVSLLLDPRVLETLVRRGAGSTPEEEGAWVRGLFGACGALYLPKTGYHLVFRPPRDEEVLLRLRGFFRRRRIPSSRRERDGRQEITLRDQGKIADFLARMGLMQSVLRLEETAIVRSLRDRANKLVNCDAANIAKSLDAAAQQLRMVRALEERCLEESLPLPLRELVEARRDNPSLSLRELGQILPHPVSKSTVEYRWRKLEGMFSSLLKGDGEHVLGKGGCQHLR